MIERKNPPFRKVDGKIPQLPVFLIHVLHASDDRQSKRAPMDGKRIRRPQVTSH